MNKQLSFLLSLGALTLSGCKPEPSANGTAPSSPAVPSTARDAGTKATQTASVVRRIVAEQLGVPAERVLLSSTWQELGADSLDTVELVMAFEEEFHVEIPDERAEAMKTVGDAVSFLTQHAKP